MCDDDCPLTGLGAEGEYRVVGPSRREFLSQAALAAIAAMLTGAISACGDGEIGGAGPTAPVVLEQGFTIRIADFPALQQTGGIARVDGNSANPIAVTRTGSSTFVALSMICPHAGYQPISIVSNGFRCPNHGATFAANGSWTGGQRTRALQSYPTVYNAGAGTLTIG
jgi:Rieske Fe-S protein